MIVVDASAIVDALISAESDNLSRLRVVLASNDLAAPQLLDYEVVSALKRVTLSGALSESAALDALAAFDELAIARWSFFDGFRRRAFELGKGLGAYDAAYVVLAEALEATLVTRDRKLAKAAGRLVSVTVV
ncbi:MAG: type II toxin-antitoxin system VapC family toxin [Aeromicrobium sp.]